MKNLLYRLSYSKDVTLDNISKDQFDEDNYFFDLEIKIITCDSIENEDEYTEIGFMKLTFFDSEMICNDHADITEIIDSRSQEFYDAVNCLFDAEENFLSDEYLNERLDGSILYLERLYIMPQYRQYGYGRETMKNLDQIISKLCGLNFSCMVMVPAAFEYKDADTYEDFCNEEEITDGKNLSNKLATFYQKYGFRPIGGHRTLYRIFNR